MYEDTLNMISNWGHVHQHHNEIPFHIYLTKYKQPKNNSAENVDHRYFSHLVDGFTNCYNSFVKATWHFPVKKNVYITYNPAIPLPGIYSKEC